MRAEPNARYQIRGLSITRSNWQLLCLVCDLGSGTSPSARTRSVEHSRSHYCFSSYFFFSRFCGLGGMSRRQTTKHTLSYERYWRREEESIVVRQTCFHGVCHHIKSILLLLYSSGSHPVQWNSVLVLFLVPRNMTRKASCTYGRRSFIGVKICF